MNCYYSILKISTNPDLNDTISIGLLLLTKDRYYFKYSEDILKQIKPLISKEFASIEKSLRIIHRKINTMDNFQLDLYSSLNPFFNQSFLQKLAIENTGVIRFSKPKSIILTHINNDSFQSLFYRILGEFKRKIVRRKNKEKELIYNKLIRPLKNVVHTQIVLKSQDLEELYFHYTLESIGSNKFICLAKYFDFGQTPQTLDMKVLHLIMLINALKKKYNKEIKSFVLATEPLKVKTKGYRIYQFMVQNSLLDVRSPEEAGIIANYFLDGEFNKFM